MCGYRSTRRRLLKCWSLNQISRLCYVLLNEIFVMALTVLDVIVALLAIIFAIEVKNKDFSLATLTNYHTFFG